MHCMSCMHYMLCKIYHGCALWRLLYIYFHVQGKLCWQHDDQMCLEKVFILEAVVPTAEHALPEADSLSGHRHRKELAAALDAACKYEQKHNLCERWSQDSAEYQQAMPERKGY